MGSSPTPGHKKGPPTRGKAQTKNHYKVMKEKLFIQESDLGEILEALAEEAIKHSDKFSTHATIKCDFDGLHLRVDVRDRQTYKELVSKTYYIVRELENNDSIVDDTITLAIGKLRIQQEKEAQEAQEESENNN